MLLTVKCFNNKCFDFIFQLFFKILLYLMIQTYHETIHILNNSEFKIKFLSITGYIN